MSFIVFVAGKSKEKLLGVAIGRSATPNDFVSMLESTLPFELQILGTEPGGEDRYRELQSRFSETLVRGFWYRASDELIGYAKGLPELDAKSPTKRVSLDLDPEDFADLETFVREKGVKTKSSLLRRAYRFYRALHRYQAQGYLIQAIKGGKLIQFPDLDDIRD